MEPLFFRHGSAFTGTPQFTAKGQAFIVRPHKCGRCGGLGGGEQWRHTGWTCFQCGGKGNIGIDTVKLFTADKIAKLDATAAKRAATKAAKAAEAKAIADAEVEARRAQFLALHGALLDRAATFADRNPFIADVVAKAHAKAALTEGQETALVAAIARIEASDAKKAASGFVGKVGERLTLTVTAERVNSIETQFGTLRIVTMRDADGNAIVSKGRFVPPTARWNESDGWQISAEPFTVKATVKDHSSFRDERQTIVQRVAEVAAAQKHEAA